jgi:hypothetical protein
LRGIAGTARTAISDPLRRLADEMEARADELEREHAPSDADRPLMTVPSEGDDVGAASCLLFVVTLMLTGCPGPNYAPYDHMTNSYG